MCQIINLRIFVLFLIGFGSNIVNCKADENVAPTPNDGDESADFASTFTCNSTTDVTLKKSFAEYNWIIKGFLSTYKDHLKPFGKTFEFSTKEIKFNTTNEKLTGNWKFTFESDTSRYLSHAKVRANYTKPNTCIPDLNSEEKARTSYDDVDLAWKSYQNGYYTVTMQIIVNDTVHDEFVVSKLDGRYSNDRHRNGKPALMPCDENTVTFTSNNFDLNKLLNDFQELSDIEIRFKIMVYKDATREFKVNSINAVCN